MRGRYAARRLCRENEVAVTLFLIEYRGDGAGIPLLEDTVGNPRTEFPRSEDALAEEPLSSVGYRPRLCGNGRHGRWQGAEQGFRRIWRFRGGNPIKRRTRGYTLR